MVVSSWQASSKRDPVEIVTSSSDLLDLIERRGGTHEWVAWKYEQLLHYWGVVKVGVVSANQSRIPRISSGK
jgi:hypothetical protein